MAQRRPISALVHVTAQISGQMNRACAQADSGDDGAPGSEGNETMVLLLRGVQWRAASTESGRVWQHLAQSWTTDTFADNSEALRHGGAKILVHAGMAKLATAAYDAILPHLAGHDRASLALLLAIRTATSMRNADH